MNKIYRINNDTLAVRALGSSCCMIYEVDKDLEENNSLYKVLDNSCKYFGSSLKGRIEGSKHIMGNKYKSPIIVNQYENLIFFATRSFKDISTYIISYNNIKFYEKDGMNTKIIFKNDREIVLNESYTVFKNQYLNADMLYRKLENIKNTSK